MDGEYSIFVKTGLVDGAGTDSVISVRLYNKRGQHFEIENLETWGGKMGPGHDYFENGNLDAFIGKGPYFSDPVCKLELISNGTGEYPGWYVDWVAVGTTKAGAKKGFYQRFDVYQWLAVDEPPYMLSTIRNNCSCV